MDLRNAEKSHVLQFVEWLEASASVTPGIGLVGGKAANLAKMVRAGLPVPPCFCVNTKAFEVFSNILNPELDMLLSEGHRFSATDITARAESLRKKGLSAQVPSEIREEIEVAYQKLLESIAPMRSVAVRSSATVEDARLASFAGQLDTFSGVRGRSLLLHRVKGCWLSAFSSRIVAYASATNVPLRELKVGVVVQEMIACEKAGVMFTIHPVSRDRGKCVVESSWGLGESVVFGKVSCDRYVVDKKNLTLIEETISRKRTATMLSDSGTETVEVPRDQQTRSSLNLSEIVSLARLGLSIEKLFGYPQDVEWGIASGHIYIFQSRPVSSL